MNENEILETVARGIFTNHAKGYRATFREGSSSTWSRAYHLSKKADRENILRVCRDAWGEYLKARAEGKTLPKPLGWLAAHYVFRGIGKTALNPLAVPLQNFQDALYPKGELVA